MSSLTANCEDLVEIVFRDTDSFIDESIILDVLKQFSGRSITVTFNGGILGSVPLSISLNGGAEARSMYVSKQSISGVNFSLNRSLRKAVFRSLIEAFPFLRTATFAEVSQKLKCEDARDLILTYGDKDKTLINQPVCPNCGFSGLTPLYHSEGNTITGFLCNEHSVYSRCNECELVFLKRQLGSSDLHTYYREEVYPRSDASVMHLERWQNLDSKTTSHYDNYTHTLPLLNSAPKVLDLGCGNGDFVAFIKHKIPGSLVTGVDWFIPQGLQDAFEQIGIEYYNAKLSEFAEQTHLSGYFDLISLWEVIEHLNIDDLKSMLCSLKKVMSKQSVLILSTPDFDDPFCQSLDFWNMAAGEHISVFNFNSLSRLLAECGFKIDKIERESVTTKKSNAWYQYGAETNSSLAGKGNAQIMEVLLDNDTLREPFKRMCRDKKLGSELIVFASLSFA
ncbi:class I SAM-dependent methyltransferase [Alteromonas sediminis]|uniref:class I SAM-dependent methyltransferase n=1 Tax=Alteromonas sediminis TaxID=2259342 RepID=UPI001404DA03|nr:class I SAM-dependent methyltransferase [Alteromonas sediminis]